MLLRKWLRLLGGEECIRYMLDNLDNLFDGIDLVFSLNEFVARYGILVSSLFRIARGRRIYRIRLTPPAAACLDIAI
jgi:hypothetical protein